MHKRGKFLHIKSAALTQIFLLVLGTAAIAFIIGEANIVSSVWGISPTGAIKEFASVKDMPGDWWVTNDPAAAAKIASRLGNSVTTTPTLVTAPPLVTAPITTTTATQPFVYAGTTFPAGTTVGPNPLVPGGLVIKNGATSNYIAPADAAKFQQEYTAVGAPQGPATFNVMGLSLTGWQASLASGVVWGIAAAGAGQLIGSLIGLNKDQTNALSAALGAGAFAYQALQALGPGQGALNVPGFSWVKPELFGWSGLAAAGVAFVVFYLLYKKETTQTVSFTCQPYEPPRRGEHCDECNRDPMRPCSEYRCKSLGQACEILNKGKANEKCAWKDPNDVTSPTITPWTGALFPQGLSYVTDTSIRPPALGVKIVDNSKTNKCLTAFTRLKFGIITNEQSSCKIDYVHTNNISAMKYDFGEDAGFDSNHTQEMRLPGGDALNGSASPIIKNDGTMELFIRCEDANSNSNVDEYKISFCVDKAPDYEIPRIEATSITSGSPVRYNVDNATIEVYTNEPADCKWSSNSGESYANMPNSMSCSSSARDINARLSYTCSGLLTEIKNRENNNYYFKCKDKAGNEMTTSYPFVLRGTQPLNVVYVAPNETVFGSTTTVPVELTLQTDDGADEGNATCYYSPTGTRDSYLEMYLTNSYLHNQSGLGLTAGDYTYYFTCVDLGGNNVSATTSFKVFVDNAAPVVTSAYKDSNSALRIVTNENAECTYSLKDCNFNLKEGIALTYSNPDIKNVNFIPDWKSNTVYYIKCKDSYGNEPGPNECTVAVNSVPSSAVK